MVRQIGGWYELNEKLLPVQQGTGHVSTVYLQ